MYYVYTIRCPVCDREIMVKVSDEIVKFHKYIKDKMIGTCPCGNRVEFKLEDQNDN